MHWEILDEARKKLLPRLACIRPYGFYLAGGTALALQLGHRTSVDFDFYTKTPFDEMLFEREIVQAVAECKVTHRASGTLFGQAKTIDMSFFHYPYLLIEPVVQTDYLDLASIPDIAAMKLIAVSQRGIKRDFLDLYVIAQENPLEKIFAWADQKFPQSDPHVCLKALTYFKDAEEDESGRGTELKEPVPWPTIKKFFDTEGRRLAKLWLL